MRYFFLDNSPLIIGKNHEVTVPVGNHHAVVILLSENLTKLCRENYSSLFVYGVMILTPKNGHYYPPLKTTLLHYKRAKMVCQVFFKLKT
jgi:hypothetical protein